MEKVNLFPRTLAFFLTLALALPSPALALRVQTGPESRALSGLEEELKPIVPSAAGLEEKLAGPETAGDAHRTVQQGMRALRMPGDRLERMLRRNLLRILNAKVSEPKHFNHVVLERRRFVDDSTGAFSDPGNRFAQFVYEIPGQPSWRELHFHYALEDANGGSLRVGGQLPMDESGTTQFPLWMESEFGSAPLKSPISLSVELDRTMVSVKRDGLPQGFFDPLSHGLEWALGLQWKQRLLQTKPKGSYVSVEPLLTRVENYQLLERRARESSALGETVRNQAWSHRSGYSDSPGITLYQFPLIVTGELRRVLNARRLLADTPENRQIYWEKMRKGSGEDPFDAALTYVDPASGNIEAYYNQGFLLIKPSRSFRDQEELLERIFLWGAELSLQLEQRLGVDHDLTSFMDSFVPPELAGLEEGNRTFYTQAEAGELLLRYHRWRLTDLHRIHAGKAVTPPGPIDVTFSLGNGRQTTIPFDSTAPPDSPGSPLRRLLDQAAGSSPNGKVAVRPVIQGQVITSVEVRPAVPKPPAAGLEESFLGELLYGGEVEVDGYTYRGRDGGVATLVDKEKDAVIPAARDFTQRLLLNGDLQPGARRTLVVLNQSNPARVQGIGRLYTQVELGELPPGVAADQVVVLPQDLAQVRALLAEMTEQDVLILDRDLVFKEEMVRTLVPFGVQPLAVIRISQRDAASLSRFELESIIREAEQIHGRTLTVRSVQEFFDYRIGVLEAA